MQERSIRGVLFVLFLIPFLWVFYGAVTGGLGPDPAEQIMHVTGEWSLRLLILTLLASPLRSWTGSSLPLKLRRMMGLYAFFYACVHFMTFLQFFTGWSAALLLEEIVERPYVTAGFVAWLMMLPLALTSTRKMQRRMGRGWAKLHRLVYVAAIGSSVHLLWQARSDIGEALIYGVVFAGLLAWRVHRRASLATG
jgi:methionine sulfoxide reductase heme-binding subunit